MLTAKLGFQPLLPSRCYRSFHHAVHRTTRSVRSLAIGVGDYFYTTKWSFIYLIKIRLKFLLSDAAVYNIQDSETPHNDSPGLRIYRGNVGTPHWRWSRSTLQGYSGKHSHPFFFCWFIYLKKLQQWHWVQHSPRLASFTNWRCLDTRSYTVAVNNIGAAA